MAKKPKVKAITRKNNKFTFAWDQQESNIIDQQARWSKNYTTVKSSSTLMAYINGDEKEISVSKSDKTASKSVTLSDYNGDKKILQAINFMVRGKYQVKDKKGKVKETHWTDWNSTQFKINPPSVTLTSEHTSPNATKFTWSCANDTTGHNPANDVIYQTILVKDCPVSKTNELKDLPEWSSASNVTKALSGNKTETEVGLGSDSYTRIVRVRARGAGGTSAWKYAQYCYGTPYAAANFTASAVQKSTGIAVDCSFNAANDPAHPIEMVYVDYVIDVPETGMSAPSSGWAEAWHGKDTNKKKPEHWAFTIENASIGADKCLFLRVRTIYGDRSETSDPIIPEGGYGVLKDSTITSITDNTGTHSVQITASNGSDVPGSKIAVSYIDANGIGHQIGILPYNSSYTATFLYPEDETPEGFYIQGFVGDDFETSPMYSSIVYQSGLSPKAPTITVEPADRVGVAKVSWSWSWDGADQTEVSWSDYEHAWESTDQPDVHTVSRVRGNYLYVTGLDTGTRLYFRARFIAGYDDDAMYGPYSEPVSIVLESAPDIPVLELSKGVIPSDGETKATWVYVSKDGTEQAKAQICEWDPDESDSGDGYENIIAEVDGEQFCNISGEGWTTGTTHLLSVRVWSSKGQASEWSDPVSLTIAEPITCTITSTSLVSESIDIGGGDTRTCLSLKALPFTATITGVGVSGDYRVLIKRASAYHVPRPDGNEFDGYEGETIGIFEQTGNGSFSIGADDRLMFDDDGTYILEATITDEHGQKDTAELEFEVHWTTQALMPTATVITERNIARITPRATAQAGATCDIYRLSAEKPQLILQDGTFGKVYVDPYPAIGEHGGYRVVFKTANGDYTTSDGKPAWYDVPTNMRGDKLLINFNGETVALAYNIDESNSWGKDFTETHYLGGAIQGYWNAGVERSGSIKAVAVSKNDTAMIDAMRRLAQYSGVCHIRTVAGASYDADIQVSEDIPQDTAHKVLTFNLSINKVDGSGHDAMELSQWEAQA